MGRPRKQRSDEVLIAIETGVVNVDGEEILLRRGVTRAHSGSRVAQLYRSHFKPIDVHYPVEQMTAAPGEKRGA